MARQERLDTIAADVFDAAAWVGSRPRVTVDASLAPHTRARCTVRRGRQRIRVHPRVLDEPDAVQRGTVGHEVAHLLEPPAGLVTALPALALWLGAIGCVIAGFLSPQHAVQLQGTGFALAVVAWAAAVIPQRRCEMRADNRSIDLVGKDAVLQTLRHLNRETPVLFSVAAALGLETHPSPAQRIRRVTRVTDESRQP